MKDSLKLKLDRLLDRLEELTALMGDPDVINQQQTFQLYAQEYAQILPITENWQAIQDTQQAIADANELLKDDDEEMRQMAQEDLAQSKITLMELESALEVLLLPQDPNDKKNVFLEIRAGTGGNEAAIFAGDLFKMYMRYAESQNWQTEIMSMNESEQGGFKEIICLISGQSVYSHLKFESGAHRVQRVPETESQGRVHTSAATVAILPEADEIEAVEIDHGELRIDTFRASGAGGQHVNKTDSAIRITHLPTGMVVECQDERSQHKNKARALSLLSARLLEGKQIKQQQEHADQRRNLVGSGDRSERIRTYNFPQGRVTDHRIGLTLYQLSDIMLGQLSDLINPLMQEHQADQLAMMEQ